MMQWGPPTRILGGGTLLIVIQFFLGDNFPKMKSSIRLAMGLQIKSQNQGTL